MPITTTKTRQVADKNITYAKVQDISAANVILGRYSGGAGVTQELSVGTGLSISGSSLIANISGTTNYIPIYTSANALGNSTIQQYTVGPDVFTNFSGGILTGINSLNSTTINSEQYVHYNAALAPISTSSTILNTNFNSDLLDGQHGSHYLARANHTGTQTASTISDFNATARGLFSSTATGLTYTSGTGVFSLTSGYVIPTTTEQSNWNTAYTNRITTLTTTGTGGAATLIGNTLNIPIYGGGSGGSIVDNGLTPTQQNSSSFWVTYISAVANSTTYSIMTPTSKFVISPYYDGTLGMGDFVNNPINADLQVGSTYNLSTPFAVDEASSVFIGMNLPNTPATQKKHGLFITEAETTEPAYSIIVKNPTSAITLFSVVQGQVYGSSSASFDTVNAAGGYIYLGPAAGVGDITITNNNGQLGTNSPFSSTGFLRASGSSAYLILQAYTGAPGSVPTPAASNLNIATDGTSLFTKNSSGVANAIITADQTQTLTNKTITGLILSANTATVAPITFTATGAALETASEQGDMEVDSAGLLYYSTAASSRGVVQTDQVQILTSNYTTTAPGTASTLRQAFNASAAGAVTVAGSTTYQFECLLNLSGVGGTTALGFGFLGTATYSSVSYIAIANKTALTVQTASSHTFGTAATFTTVTASNNVATGYIYVKGTLVVTAGGTIIPAVGTVGASLACTVQARSYFKLTKIGSNTVTTIGNWS